MIVLLAVVSGGCASGERLSALSIAPLYFEDEEKEFLDALQKLDRPSRLITITKSVGWNRFQVVDRWSIKDYVFVNRYEAGAEGIEEVFAGKVHDEYIAAWYRGISDQVIQQSRPADRGEEGVREVTVHVAGTPSRVLHVWEAERIVLDDMGMAVRIAAHLHLDALDELEPFEIAQLATSAGTIPPRPEAYIDLLVRLYDALIVSLNHAKSRAADEG